MANENTNELIELIRKKQDKPLPFAELVREGLNR